MGNEQMLIDAIAKHEADGNPIMKYFRFSHLPEHLKQHSRPWAELAANVCDSIPPSAERTVALRKLLEGKDAAVRAAMP